MFVCEGIIGSLFGFQENETFSWHALTLELPPTPRKSEIFVCKPISRSQYSLAAPVPPLPPSSLPSPIAEKCETVSPLEMSLSPLLKKKSDVTPLLVGERVRLGTRRKRLSSNRQLHEDGESDCVKESVGGVRLTANKRKFAIRSSPRWRRSHRSRMDRGDRRQYLQKNTHLARYYFTVIYTSRERNVDRKKNDLSNEL